MSEQKTVKQEAHNPKISYQDFLQAVAERQSGQTGMLALPEEVEATVLAIASLISENYYVMVMPDNTKRLYNPFVDIQAVVAAKKFPKAPPPHQDTERAN